MDYAGVDPILEPIPVRPGAHYHMGGVDTDVRRQHDPARPVRRRRVRVRLGARRQPPRRQLADGDGHVRPPRRPATPATRRSRTATARSCPSRRVRDADAPHPRDLRPLRRRSARGRCARSSRPRCTTTPASSARSERLERCLADGRRAARARARRRRRRHGRPLQHRSRLRARAREHARDGRLPRHGRARAHRSRAARTRASTTPSATTSAGCGTRSTWNDGGDVRLDYKPVTVTRFQPMVRSY